MKYMPITHTVSGRKLHKPYLLGRHNHQYYRGVPVSMHSDHCDNDYSGDIESIYKDVIDQVLTFRPDIVAVSIYQDMEVICTSNNGRGYSQEGFNSEECDILINSYDDAGLSDYHVDERWVFDRLTAKAPEPPRPCNCGQDITNVPYVEGCKGNDGLCLAALEKEHPAPF